MNSTSEVSLFSNVLTLVEYCAVECVYLVAALHMLRILNSLYKRAKGRISFQEKNGLSNLLITNLVCWAILTATALPHNLWMIANWRPSVRYVDANFLFWSTILTQCMMSVLPYSVFFLSLDRSFSIQLLTSYQERHKLILLAVCLISLSVVFVVNLLAFIQIMPLPEKTACTVFACLMTNGNNVFIATKLIGAALIICSGIYFLHKLRKRRGSIQTAGAPPVIPVNQRGANKIEANTLVVVMIAMEILLNFVPQLVVLLIQNLLHHSIAAYIGPHNLTLNATEGLITSLIYRHTLKRYIVENSTTSQMSVHVVAPKRSTIFNAAHPQHMMFAESASRQQLARQQSTLATTVAS